MVQLDHAWHGLWYAEEQTTADRLGSGYILQAKLMWELPNFLGACLV